MTTANFLGNLPARPRPLIKFSQTRDEVLGQPTCPLFAKNLLAVAADAVRAFDNVRRWRRRLGFEREVVDVVTAMNAKTEFEDIPAGEHHGY